MNRLRLRYVLCGILSLLSLLSALGVAAPGNPKQAAPVEGKQSPAALLPMSPLDALLWQKLSRQLIDVAEQTDAVVGFELCDLRSGQRVSHHADRVFATASAIKTALLVSVLDQLGRTEGSALGSALGSPYVVRSHDLIASSPILSGLTLGVTSLQTRDLLAIMIATSDNTATNLLLDRVGFDRVNQLLDRAGLTKMRMLRKMLDSEAVRQGKENIATPHELALLYEKLWRGELLDNAQTQDALRMLSVSKHGYLEASLPDEVTVYSKPGSLPGLRVDAGLVMIPQRPFSIAVMVAMPQRERDAELLIEQLAKRAYLHLLQAARSTPFGRQTP